MNMNSGPSGRNAQSINDAIEQGIEAAKSGNRLLARWQLESVAVGNDVRPEIWMWLAWVAESPAKAQSYLNNVLNHPRLGVVAQGGLGWLSLLTGDPIPAAATGTQAIPAKLEQPSQTAMTGPFSKAPPLLQRDETSVRCPSCEATLYVRPSAIGRPRLCPACDGKFLVEVDRSGKVHAHTIHSTVPGEFIPNEEFASPVPINTAPVGANGDTILVVDDSPTIRRIASLILTKNGYGVLTANNGEDGLVMAQSNLPSLILLDINMPGIGGYETCKRLRSNRSTHHIPIVMLSGNDGLFDQVKGYQAGSSKYLTKPCDARAMLTAVGQLLSRPTALNV